MPVVKGDRIGESQRLNMRSVEAQDFYAHFVTSKILDDFLRFRLQTSAIVSTMYPRRELTAALIRRAQRLIEELGTGELPLWRTWVVDGITFAELTTGKARGNRYHRTPEPPWSDHAHSGACVPTAIHRAREWGFLEIAEALSLQLKKIRERRPTETVAGTPVPSAPSSPSSPSAPSNGVVPIGVIGGRALESPPGSDGRPPAPAASPIPNDQVPADTERLPTGEELWAANEAVQAQRRRVSDYDPGRILEVRVIDRCLDLASKLAAREFQVMGDEHVKRALEAMTTTKRGYPMRVVKGAKDAWLEASLRQADEFEDAEFGGDPLDRELPSEDAQPPPPDDDGPPF
jgi:hypothetical protein